MKPAAKGKRLIGIVPLASNEENFGLPWSGYFNIIGDQYMALERSIYECAVVGCESIWVVCNDDTSPLVKERVGDYVLNPNFYEQRDFIKNKENYKKYIPIFYTPVPYKDRERRNSLSWSILQGALTAFKVSSSLSSWANPTKYYVSFPYGVYDPEELRKHKTLIKGNKSFLVSYEGSTVQNNLYLGFTFFPEEWLEFKREIKTNCSGGDKNLPLLKRWSSRNFKLDKIFNSDIMNIENNIEVSTYYDISNWEGLLKYYKSDCILKKPESNFMKPYFMKRD